ncbi:hypothetical protein [Halorarius litoreus]|uniref:hypothetical protein n=1 Tax=Halorarius litoreus TaxID=2962676 RepID=UPI0020CFC363|nr:hypothetical protein [Halorarius litoreus]
MDFNVRDFDDLPQGWSLETQTRDEIEFERTDTGLVLRLTTDAAGENTVSLWPPEPTADPLFTQQFVAVRDALRTADSVMQFYNAVRGRTVTQVMERVSSTYSVLDAVQELDHGLDAETSGVPEQLTDDIGAALREEDYDRVEQQSEAVKWVLGGHLESTAE